jgi:hypothetical protein
LFSLELLVLRRNAVAAEEGVSLPEHLHQLVDGFTLALGEVSPKGAAYP